MRTWLKRLLACWGCALAILASAQTRMTVVNRSGSPWTLRANAQGPKAHCRVRLDGTRLGLDGSHTPGPADPLLLWPGLAYDLTWDAGATPVACIAFGLHDLTAGDSNPFQVNLIAQWAAVPGQAPPRLSLGVVSLAPHAPLRPEDIQQKLGRLDGSEFIIHGDSYRVFQGPSLIQQLLGLLAGGVPRLPQGPTAGAGAPQTDRAALLSSPLSLPALDGTSVVSMEEGEAEPRAGSPVSSGPAGAGSRKRPRGEDGAGPSRKRPRLQAKPPVAGDPSESDAEAPDGGPEAAAAPRAKYGSRHIIKIRNESGGPWTLRAALRKDVAVATTPVARSQAAAAAGTWATALKRKDGKDVEVAFTLAHGTCAAFDLSASSNRIQRHRDERLRSFHLVEADREPAAGARFQVASVAGRVRDATPGAAGKPAPGGTVKRRLPRILLDPTSPARARLRLSEQDTCITLLPLAAGSEAAPAATAASADPLPAPARLPAAEAGAGQGSGSGQGAGAGAAPAQPAPRPAPETLTIRNDSAWDWSFTCEAPARTVLAEGSGPGQKPALLTPDQPGRREIPVGATATFRAADGIGWVELAFALVSADPGCFGLEPFRFSWAAAGPESAQAPPRLRCLEVAWPAELEPEGDRTLVIRKDPGVSFPEELSGAP